MIVLAFVLELKHRNALLIKRVAHKTNVSEPQLGAQNNERKRGSVHFRGILYSVKGISCLQQENKKEVYVAHQSDSLISDLPDYVYRLSIGVSLMVEMKFFRSSDPPILEVPLTWDLVYGMVFGFELTAFSDVDHAGCIDTRKSTSGGIQFLGDKLVSWMSKKQNCTAMSSAEAEYVALSASCAQVMWMRTQLQDYGFNYNKIPLYSTSQSAIAIRASPCRHSRTKHIHTRYHFIKEQVENGIIELYFVRTEYQLAENNVLLKLFERFQYSSCQSHWKIGFNGYDLIPYNILFHDDSEVHKVVRRRMPTKIEITLEQSQQGVSNDVLVSIEGVEE
ncbi:hypothetical protein Tco_1504894 [Tanacetum coccineum]